MKFGISIKLGKVIFSRLMQSLKHDNPIDVIDEGRSISVSDVHPSNMLLPSVVTDDGMVILTSSLQP